MDLKTIKHEGNTIKNVLKQEYEKTKVTYVEAIVKKSNILAKQSNKVKG